MDLQVISCDICFHTFIATCLVNTARAAVCVEPDVPKLTSRKLLKLSLLLAPDC